jgi:hypothetical protein
VQTAGLTDAGRLDYAAERVLGRQEYVWGANMAIPRAVMDAVGAWNEAAGLQGEGRVEGDSSSFEDTELQDRVRAAGGTVWFSPGAVVEHRVDRRAVTPRRLAANAFARGRNEAWRETSGAAASATSGLLAHLGAAVRWCWWATLRRLSGAPRYGEPVRRAAWATGFTLDRLRVRGSERLFRAVARLTFLLRGLLVRLTPDVP